MLKENQKNRKRHVTIKDVAQAAGCSIATVSYVLNNTPGQTISEDTKKKVLQFANLLGYECNVMARYLATGKTNTVSAIIKDVQPFASQYYLKLLTELSRLLFRRQFDLRISDYDDGMKHDKGCDAYITIGLSASDFRAFADTKYVPVVAIDSVINDFLFFRINDDYDRLAARARSTFETDRSTLLTFALPDEVLDRASKSFNRIAVIRELDEIYSLDPSENYITVSSSIYDNAVKRFKVSLESASFALKASAAAEYTVKAIERINCSDDEHDVRI